MESAFMITIISKDVDAAIVENVKNESESSEKSLASYSENTAVEMHDSIFRIRISDVLEMARLKCPPVERG